MTPARDLRDRVAEVLWGKARDYDRGQYVWPDSLGRFTIDRFTRGAADLVSALAAAGLQIVEKGAPHD